MRLVLVWLALLAGLPLQAQNKEFEQLLAAGKAEFRKPDPAAQDYHAAATALEAAVRLRPDDAEAHYFLGYAYSRLSSRDGETLHQTKSNWTRKASQEMETVNRLAPRYSGEMLALDPYSKLSSLWGTQAMAYHVRQQPDSVRWAFTEGRKRGGFSDFTLRFARTLLDQCSRNGILLSAGDLFDVTLWYVQLQEGYRRDVTVVDVAMLGAPWYAPWLQAHTPVKFADLSGLKSDSTFYIPWETVQVSVPNARTRKPFQWTVYPSVDSAYLQRSDDLLLQLLFQNEFRRDVYFTPGFPPGQQISLRPYAELLPRLVLDQLNAAHEADMPLAQYLAGMNRLLPLVNQVNPNSSGETELVQLLRYGVLLRIEQANRQELRAERPPLVELIDRYFPPSKYPFGDVYLESLYRMARYGL